MSELLTHIKYEQAHALCGLQSFKMVNVVTNDMGQPKLKAMYIHITETAYEYVN
jgi:hypothetical protein